MTYQLLPEQHNVVLQDTEELVLVLGAESLTTLLACGPQGPAGSVGYTGVAGEDLSGQRVVTARDGLLYYADQASDVDIAGITTGAALAGESVTLVPMGKVTEPSWAWTKGAVYLGTNGHLTQEAPMTGYLVRLGWAMDAHTILLQPEQALKLA